jgi:multidrug resistance efflux pump
VENRRGAYLAAEGAMQAAVARAEQARITYQSQIDGVHTSVARLRAELRDAEYNLELTTVGRRDLGSSPSLRFDRECT